MLIFEDREQVMFDWLRYRYRLWQLQSEKKRNDRINLDCFLNDKDPPKTLRDTRLIEDEILQLMSDYIANEAEKLYLSMPPSVEHSL
jgi:hypothetical protein